MRTLARIALAITVVLGGMVLLPRPASRLVAPDAVAQLLPSPEEEISDVLEEADDLTSSPTPESSPESGGGSGSGSGGGSGGGSGSGSTKTSGGGSGGGKTTSGATSTAGAAQTATTKAGGQKRDNEKKRRPKRDANDRPRPGGGFFVGGGPTGQFNTDRLVAVAAHLRSLGVPTDEVIRRVFPPFIVAGYSGWTNTWGAPRFGPGPVVRKHQGQDVFCDFGAPVLASEAGTVEFDEGGLGGKVARLHRPDGSYWYYAHLSDWNIDELSSGDRAQPGDVIGYCGNSGNALETPPHVHFGWYAADGTARNPMRILVRWLRQAERRALDAVEAETGERVEAIAHITLARRFGDAFAPDRSLFSISGESLWATGSYPGSGAFTVAETALRAALSSTLVEGVPVRVEDGSGDDVMPHAELSPTAVLRELSDDGHLHGEDGD